MLTSPRFDSRAIPSSRARRSSLEEPHHGQTAGTLMTAEAGGRRAAASGPRARPKPEVRWKRCRRRGVRRPRRARQPESAPRPASRRSGRSSPSTSGSPTSIRTSSASTSTARNRAKSRQFSSDMDIFRRGDRGRRPHRPARLPRGPAGTKNTGMDKRLVFKLFNETRQLARHHGPYDRPQPAADAGRRGLPVTCFSINVGDHDNMVLSRALRPQMAAAAQNFSFFLLEDWQARSSYRLRRDFIDLGGRLHALQSAQPAGRLPRRQRCSRSAAKWKGKVKVGARRPAPR